MEEQKKNRQKIQQEQKFSKTGTGMKMKKTGDISEADQSRETTGC